MIQSAIRSPISRLVRPSFGGAGYSIATQIKALFAASEQGFVDDPTYLTSLLQDASGTTSVTAAGQPVGLRLDMRLGMARGAQAWSDAAAVFAGESSRVSPGVYRIYSSVGVFSDAHINLGLVISKTYEVLLNIDSVTVQGAGVQIDAAGAVPFTGTGPKRCVFTANATTISIKRASTACDIQISGVDIRELRGNHATQPTAPARPLYQSGPARLVFDGGDDAHVTTFAAALGSNCTVIRSVPGIGTTILTGQTIGTTYTNTTTHSGLIVIDRPLTAAETLTATRWGNQRAGV